MKVVKITRCLLILLLVFGMSTGADGQEKAKRTLPKMVKGGRVGLLIPVRDTVIMRGEAIEVGTYLHKTWTRGAEIEGYGVSKKSDMEKGYYTIIQKPKQTITYRIKHIDPEGSKIAFRRTIYVANTAEEKKQLEKQLKEKPEAEKTGGLSLSGIIMN